jgi:pimeloyl-ACP methyl ester carboxylesterase
MSAEAIPTTVSGGNVISESGTVNDLGYLLTLAGEADTQTLALLINGRGADHRHWLSFPQRLARYGISSIAMQAFREHGPSSMHEVAIELRQAADELGDQEGLNLEKIHVLGQSLGGVAAQEFAVQNEDRLGKLVLIATFPGLPLVQPENRTFDILRNEHRTIAENAEVWGGITEQVVQKFLAGEELNGHERAIFAESEAMRLRHEDSDDEQSEDYKDIIARQDHSIVSMQGIAETGLRRLKLMKLGAPVLVMAGGKDPLIPHFNTLALGAMTAQSETKVWKEAGHGLVYEVREAEGPAACPVYEDDIAKVTADFLNSPGEHWPPHVAFWRSSAKVASLLRHNPAWWLESVSRLSTANGPAHT